MINVIELKNEADKESLSYFDTTIRKLEKDKNGKVVESLVDNDIDAFRHAYVSGVFVIELSINKAAFWGYINELTGGNGSSSGNSQSFFCICKKIEILY